LYKESSSSWEDCVGEVAEETVLVSTAKMWLNMMGEASDFANTRQLNNRRNKGEARTKSIGFCEARSEALTNLRKLQNGGEGKPPTVGRNRLLCSDLHMRDGGGERAIFCGRQTVQLYERRASGNL
jgi:hypothetical protein